MALRNLLSGADFKPPEAAIIKSNGCEHFGKVKLNLTFPKCSQPLLLIIAASGGLKSAPESRFRRAIPSSFIELCAKLVSLCVYGALFPYLFIMITLI